MPSKVYEKTYYMYADCETAVMEARRMGMGCQDNGTFIGEGTWLSAILAFRNHFVR